MPGACTRLGWALSRFDSSPDTLGFVLIRDALQAEMAEVGQLRVTAYRTGGHLSQNSEYEAHLRELGADGLGDVLVAIAPPQPGSGRPGTITGTVMLQLWPNAGHVVTGPGEAEVRALAVAPEAQGSGVGSALIQAIIARAKASDVSVLLLFTQPDMRIAQRLYERTGFRRLAARDWSPAPGTMLLAYELPLPSVI
jgi:ribosomal protein S18 acetylase RimI-like enzyme